ncbi:MAG: hypothetical protein ABW219_06605 [Ilumatobacteraceae bacterium]
MTARPLAVVDLDGVVADVRHRLHHLDGRRKDWARFFAAARADPSHPEGLAVVARLAEDHDIVYLTGRPEHLRADTEAWLDDAGLGGRPVVMRPDRDRRPAVRYKLEQLAELARDRTIGVVVDDDPVVVEAARDAGWPVFEATWERRDAAQADAVVEAQEVDGAT